MTQALMDQAMPPPARPLLVRRRKSRTPPRRSSSRTPPTRTQAPGAQSPRTQSSRAQSSTPRAPLQLIPGPRMRDSRSPTSRRRIRERQHAEDGTPGRLQLDGDLAHHRLRQQKPSRSHHPRHPLPRLECQKQARTSTSPRHCHRRSSSPKTSPSTRWTGSPSRLRHSRCKSDMKQYTWRRCVPPPDSASPGASCLSTT